MKLVVGLGNPGRKYEDTRHNVGFSVIQTLADQYGTGAAKSRFHGHVVEANLDGWKVLLLGPTTYMNRSGTSVLAARDFYKLQEEDLLVICDDLNLPPAKLRFRAKGSSGGQKGLGDIIRRLGTEDFSRLRIGVGPPRDGWDAASHVLAKVAAREKPEFDEAIQTAARAVADWVHEGVEHCMNRYN